MRIIYHTCQGFFNRLLGPDFAGYTLDFVRLNVTELNFERIEPEPGLFIDVEFNVRYDFYGVPIPEPSMSVLLITGVIYKFTERRIK